MKKYLWIALAVIVGGMLLTPSAVQDFSRFRRKFKESRVAATASELATAKVILENFRSDCGRFPTTQEGLAALENAPKGLEKKWRGPYGSVPISLDPYGTPYAYTSSGKNAFELIGYGADGKPGGYGFDADMVVTQSGLEDYKLEDDIR